MKKKIIVSISVFALFILICTTLFLVFSNKQTPAGKIERLQQEISNKEESSGYNRCVERINARNKAIEDCTTEKIRQAGYDDGLDCIGKYTDPICQSTERYNTEVNGSNECNEAIPKSEEFSDIKGLSIVDCVSLLNE